MTRPTDTPIEVTEERWLDERLPAHPVTLDDAKIGDLRRRYARQFGRLELARGIEAEATVEMDMLRLSAIELLRRAGWSWFEIMEEIKSWH